MVGFFIGQPGRWCFFWIRVPGDLVLVDQLRDPRELCVAVGRAAPGVQQIIQHRTAGDPMREEVTWTDLTPCDIASHLYQEFDTQIALQIVRRILGDLNFDLRKIAKVLPEKESPDRDRQFLRIAKLKEESLAAGNPVNSMDTKKKEFFEGSIAPGEPTRNRRSKLSITTFLLGPKA